MQSRTTALVLLFVAQSFVHAENWPGFRGPTGQGISAEKGLPTKWSDTDNVIWSAPIAGEGWSSPIVWGDQVFVTTATDSGESCRVIALARADGKELWNVEVFRQQKLRKEGRNSYATPTPVTDGKHVYAVFNDGGVFHALLGRRPQERGRRRAGIEPRRLPRRRRQPRRAPRPEGGRHLDRPG